MITLGMNAHHHQSGVLPSATPAMASEIQPMRPLVADQRLALQFARRRLHRNARDLQRSVQRRQRLLHCRVSHWRLLRLPLLAGCSRISNGFSFLVCEFLACCSASSYAVRHVRIRIADARQIGRARLRVQEIQHVVIAVLRLQLAKPGFRDRRCCRRQSPPPGRPAGRRS